MHRDRFEVVVLFVLLTSCASDDDDDGNPSRCGDGVCAGETSASCPLDCAPSGPSCGDGSCNGSETATSCPGDCGSTACSSSPDSCTGETICVSGSCVAAFPRVYSLTSISVSVPTTNPANGQAWDLGGGAPDMFVGDSTGTALTAAVADQFSASFPGPFETTLIAGATLRVDIWDEDVSTHDYVTGCQAAPVTAALLRTRSFNCSGNGITFTSTIRPK